MTIAQLLKKYNIAESELLLAKVLKQTKEFLYLNPNKNVSSSKLNKFKKLYSEYKKGVPLAYIFGYKDFFGLRFKVNRNTLIPRPESEWLVEESLKYINDNKDTPLKVLDIGTGAGSITISTASTSKIKAQFYASDISAKALLMAKQNSKNHKTKVKFMRSNLFKNITGKYDLITANLPYVPKTDYNKLHKSLKHEPKLALTDGTNNNQLILKFLGQLSLHLKPRGLALLEIDPSSKKHIALFIKKNKLAFRASFFKDYKKLIRYAKITLSK